MTQVTFSVAASADDGYVGVTEVVYPPLGTTPSAVTSQTTDNVLKSFGGGFYQVQVGLMRWDTSPLPDDATVISTVLRLNINASFGVDGRSITAEWYEPGVIDTGDWTATVSTNAHAGTLLANVIDGLTDNDFALQNLSNINLSGFTGLRLHISGAAPTGTNSFAYASFDDLALQGPRLIVEYTSALQGIDSPAPVIYGAGAA